MRARADEELEGHQQTEVALRASEARYRTLAARTNRLHGLTAALSEAVTVKAVAEAVVRQGKIAAGATAGEVAILVDNADRVRDCPFRRRRRACVNRREDSGRDRPVRHARDRDAAAGFIGSFAEWQQRYWRSASIAADGGYVSSATLPLMASGQPIGVLAFHFTAPVKFDEEYQALLVSIAQHCAQALDRARLYESAQKARTEAEAANRLKDEFVSIVSHDLRTPLNAMLGWTALLQKGTLPPTITARALQSIHDNATRQAKLIDDLLDFSRITGGRMALEHDKIDLRDLLRNVIESMVPATAAKRIELQFLAAPDATVLGDIRRLEQVFFNLIGNAVKFTDEGGRIDVSIRCENGTSKCAWPTPELASSRNSCHSCSTVSVRPTARRRGSMAAWGWAFPSRGNSSKRTRERSRSRATARIRAPRSSCDCQPHWTEGGSGHETHARAETRQPIRLDGIRVLVVDDESDSREVMAHALEDSGAVVCRCRERTQSDGNSRAHGNGCAARRHRDAGRGRLRVDPSGPVVTSRPHRHHSSGCRHRARPRRRTARALAAGFHLHLAKPFEPGQLTRTVQALARGNSLVH